MYFLAYFIFAMVPIIDVNNNYPLLLVFAYCCSGLQAIIRLSEPYVWAEFRKLIIWLKKPKGGEKFSEESLDSFIKSASNAEYVSLSLAGVITSILNGGKEFLKLRSYLVANKDLYNITTIRTETDLIINTEASHSENSMQDDPVTKEIRDQDGIVVHQKRQSSMIKDEIQIECSIWNHNGHLFKVLRLADGF